MTGTLSHPDVLPRRAAGAARAAAVALLMIGVVDLVFLNTWVFPRVFGGGDGRGRVSVARVETALILPAATSRQRVEDLSAPAAPTALDTQPPATVNEPRLRRLRQVFFARNTHGLDRVGDQILSRLAAKAIGEHVTVVIDGHADQTGSEAFNGWLSERRAVGVADRLVALGVPRDRVVIRHFGSARPAVAGDNPQALRRNRRVEIAIAEGDTL